jgi:chemotaxis protein histidine kinase CheA
VLTDDRFKCTQCPAHFGLKSDRDAHQRRCNLGALPAPAPTVNDNSSLTANVSGAGATANIDNTTNIDNSTNHITLNLSVNVFGKEDASYITEKTTEELRELLGGSFRGSVDFPSKPLLAYQIALRCNEAHPENHSIILNDPAMKKSQVHTSTGWKETDLSTALWSIMSSDAMTLSKDLNPGLTAAPYESAAEASGRPESGDLARRLLDFAHGANTRSLDLSEHKRLLAEALYSTSKLYCDNSPEAKASAKRQSKKAKASGAGVSQEQFDALLRDYKELRLQLTRLEEQSTRNAEQSTRNAEQSTLQLTSIMELLTGENQI